MRNIKAVLVEEDYKGSYSLIWDVIVYPVK